MELGVKVEVRLTDTRDDASATQSGKASKSISERNDSSCSDNLRAQAGNFVRARKGRTSMKNLLLSVVIMTLLLGSQLFAAPIELGASVQLTGQFANTGRYYGDAYQFAV
jgi:hypothetical protein